MKCLVTGVINNQLNETTVYAQVGFYNGTNILNAQTIGIDVNGIDSTEEFITTANTNILTYANASPRNYGMTAADIVWGMSASSIVLSFSAPSRSLNSAFQISTSQAAFVSYSVDIATSVSLVGGAVGTVYLEYADDSGFTTNVVEVNRFVNGNTGTLVVGLTLNQTNTAPLGGIIPVGKYVRLRTQNNTGTPTFTFRSGQEVLM